MTMRIDTGFSTQVNLPCRIHCGPEGNLELPGTTRHMDVRALTFSLKPGPWSWIPRASERIVLEIPLPGSDAKCLWIRGQVLRVTQFDNGTCHVDVRFRRAAFRDGKENGFGNQPRGSEKGRVM